MSVEDNKALVRRVMEQLAQGDSRVFDEHPGLAEIRPNFEATRVAFPDATLEVVLQFGEGDWVATRVVTRGTNTGPGPAPGMPPTGKQATWEFLAMHQIQDGRIVKQHSQADVLSVMQQLGVGPFSGSS